MEADKLVEEIFAIIHALRAQDMGSLSGDTLSRLVVKLASYKASLGEYVAIVSKSANNAEAEYYKARAEGYQRLRDSGKGSTDAEELKRLEAHDSFMALNEAKYKQDLIINLSRDCHDLIDAIRGRLIALQSERTESNVY
jgi:hypothetical protein